MEIVIKIPDEIYASAKNQVNFLGTKLISDCAPFHGDIICAIANGIPLPNVFQDIKNDMIDRSFMSDIYNDETEDEIIHLNEAFDAMDKYIRDKG